MAVEGNYVLETDIEWPADWDDARKQATIDKWEEVVEKKLGSIFYQVDGVAVYVDGIGQSYLPIEGESPLLAITSIEIDEESIDISQISFDGSTVYYKDNIRFPEGFRNIMITGSWGYATVPVSITEAVKILIHAEIYPERYELVDFESEDIGDASQRRPLFKRITGVVEADKLLTLFVRRSISIRRI